MLSESLKQHTKEKHQLLEKRLLTEIKAIENTADYANVLKHFYTFFGGLEELIDKVSTVSFLPDYHLRRKSLLLVHDLHVLQAPLPELAASNMLPRIENGCQATGAMYVMEGSSLGGTHIAEMIRKKLDQPALTAFSFFDGYGEGTQMMWGNFKKAIDCISLKKEQEALTIQAANDTFHKFDILLTARFNMQGA